MLFKTLKLLLLESISFFVLRLLKLMIYPFSILGKTHLKINFIVKYGRKSHHSVCQELRILSLQYVAVGQEVHIEISQEVSTSSMKDLTEEKIVKGH